MPDLVVETVQSASRLRRALSAIDARDYGTLDGETLTVSDEETAEMLVETYPNVRWAEASPSEPEPETAPPRGEVDTDGTTVACTVEGCDRSFDTTRGMKAHRRQAHDE